MVKHGPESYKLDLSNASKNTQIEQEMGVKKIGFPPYSLLPQRLKTRNEIVQPILGIFTH